LIFKHLIFIAFNPRCAVASGVPKVERLNRKPEVWQKATCPKYLNVWYTTSVPHTPAPPLLGDRKLATDLKLQVTPHGEGGAGPVPISG
jgi:hypothetical protein